MEQYKIDTSLDKNKVFIMKRSELEDKLEVSYHLPIISELENKVRSKSNKKLKDFIQKISSGATPSVTEEDKYYSHSANGIPFLRVQNLQSNGKLNLSDVKYINKETHESYLKRSQVDEGDLLVKITGVGRMAIASVAPENFIGNTNQHMVVIKTENKETSEYLSNYLNLDFVEKLATRRATGGTRPALDYPALKSIPIIEGIDFNLLRDAEKLKQTKETEAKKLLVSIDTYLLNELGIKLPEKDSSLEARIFITNFSEVAGTRYDPIFYNSDLKFFLNNSFGNESLKNVVLKFKSGQGAGKDDQSDEQFGVIQIRPTNIGEHGALKFNKNVFVPLNISYEKLDIDDVLFNNTNSQDLVGKSSVLKEKLNLTFSNHITVLKVDKDKLNADYLCNIFNSFQKNKIFYSICTNWNNQSGIGVDLLKKLLIPLPPIEKQNEIADHIAEIRAKAKHLQEDANSILENAKQEVERIILG